MEKHLLLAVADGTSASYTLRFIRGMIDDFCGIRLTLFYVSSRSVPWDVAGSGGDIDPQDMAERIAAGNGYGCKSAKGMKTLDQARKWLVEVAGCDSSMVDTKVIVSRKGTVREIIDEAQAGIYDALVLGRKAYSWFEGMFENSVAHAILWKAIDFPLWICRRPPQMPRSHVLLCVDGSEASMRMADHVGFMLSGESRHKVTVFYVAEKGGAADEAVRSGDIGPEEIGEGETGDGEKGGAVFDRARALLLENGVPEERIEFKMIHSSNAAKAILEENIRGQYAVIALGKRGNAPARMENIFPSSLSIKLLRMVQETTLWIGK